MAASRQAVRLVLLLGAAWSACASSGCVGSRAEVDRNLMTERDWEERRREALEYYRVAAPDTLGVRVDSPYEFEGNLNVGPDGRIDLGQHGKPRVEGKTLQEVARVVAKQVGGRPEDVHVQVAQFRSQHIYLHGQIVGWQRLVPYQGQETVLDVLQRVGGITAGAAPESVYVVRSNIGTNQRPEVYHVDLEAIVLKGDEKTNVRVMPFDQVYVGETRQSRVEKVLPPWLRGIYQDIWDTRPTGAQPREVENSRSCWIRGLFSGGPWPVPGSQKRKDPAPPAPAPGQ